MASRTRSCRSPTCSTGRGRNCCRWSCSRAAPISSTAGCRSCATRSSACGIAGTHERRRAGRRREPGEGLSMDSIVERVMPGRARGDRDRVLSVQGLVKRYGGNEVVRGLSFDIRRGECFGLLGPNGAGKTTTLRCCLGLVDPDGGTIELVGAPVPRAAREARIRVGVVPQMDNLDPDFTVTENLVVYGRYFGLHQDEVRGRIPKLLDFAG